MSVFFAKRVTALVITLMLTTVVIFLVLEILPGDPASLMLGINAEADTLAALRAELGLDRPVLVRYTSWVL
ncbi:MAG: ABC transporter permease, partial [Deltaproteobacteria bacterium]|nr:ABC transporter permease [Deltaproteobacteria bacterium]